MVSHKFREGGLVPDMLDIGPDQFLNVKFPSGAVVNLGKELTPLQVKDEPQVKYTADPNTLYTLQMTDSDAPSRQNPAISPINHWLVVNIPGSNIHQGEALLPFTGSRPDNGTGLHRYSLLVFQQPGSITVNDTAALQSRIRFHIRDFAKQYHLGNPIAGNFYQAQFDSYVASLPHLKQHKHDGVDSYCCS